MGFSLATDDSDYKDMRHKIMDEVKRALSPEFLNRIDDTIVFHSLGRAEMSRILEILIGDLQARLKEQSFSFTLDDPAKQLLIDRGFDPSLGARPLRRAIQRNLENPLAEQILAGKLRRGRPVAISVKDGELHFVQSDASGKGGGRGARKDEPSPASAPAE